jgi:hypothetical protein
MNRRRASRARAAALRALAYRIWFVDPENGAIPPIDVIADYLLQQREQDRQLRRAQLGFFDTSAPIATPRTASAI